MLKKISVLFTSLIIMLLAVSVAGCGGEEMIAQNGDVVTVHYTGTLDDGTQFDSSAGRDPLEFTVGAGEMITGFDAAVVGMKVGDYKKVTIPAAEAYGERSEEMYFEYPVSKLPEGAVPEIGDKLPMTFSNGSVMDVTVIKVDSENITLDANFELAGEDLTFEIEMVSIDRN